MKDKPSPSDGKRAQPNGSCDHHRLQALLEGRLSPSETLKVERHLSHCVACASQLQSMASADVSWTQAKTMLTSDEFDQPPSDFGSANSSDKELEDKDRTVELLTREIRGWLDPTDDPHSMGRFAGYEIRGIVGHGGMGVLLKGFEASLNRYVAIKILAPRLATNGSARKRFAREAQAAAAVRHESVISIHRVDEWHGLPFLVMPYINGISLQRRLDTDGPMSIEQALRVGLQIASGLAAAHAQGLVHRDIKPANILLEQGVERVTITDFGLARAVDDASVTRTGVIAGTPQYMSPEQAQAKPLDARSDLFSLGSVLYAMVAGRVPFRGQNSLEILKRIIHEPARSIREIQPAIPDWFECLIQKLHAKSPEERLHTADSVVELLRSCLAHVQQPTAYEVPAEIQPKHQVVAVVRSGGLVGIGKWLAGTLGLFGFLLTGILFLLETNKGTLRIESDSDDVKIRIQQGNQTVERLTLSRQGATARLQAGNYTIELDEDGTAYEVDSNQVTIKRGKDTLSRISLVPSFKKPFAADDARNNNSSKLQTVSAVEVERCLDTYWKLSNAKSPLSEADEATRQKTERAIQEYRQRPECWSLIAEAIDKWYNSVANESDRNRMIIAANCILYVSNELSEGIALNRWFNLARRMPEAASIDTYVAPAYHTINGKPQFSNPMYPEELKLSDGLAELLAHHLNRGSVEHREFSIGVLILLRARCLASSDEAADSSEYDAWMQKHAEVFVKALLNAVDSDDETLRSWVVIYLAYYSPTNDLARKKWISIIESDPSNSVRSSALDALVREWQEQKPNGPLPPQLVDSLEKVSGEDSTLQPRWIAIRTLARLQPDNDHVHQTIMQWARSGDASLIDNVLEFWSTRPFGEKAGRTKAIDEIVELLSNPTWGMNVKINRISRQLGLQPLARPYAIEMLGEFGSQALRALPTLELEESPETKTVAKLASDKIRGYSPDLPVHALQGKWRLDEALLQSHSSPNPNLKLPIDTGRELEILGTDILVDEVCVGHVSFKREEGPATFIKELSVVLTTGENELRLSSAIEPNSMHSKEGQPQWSLNISTRGLEDHYYRGKLVLTRILAGDDPS